jgi:hypothetical protein
MFGFSNTAHTDQKEHHMDISDPTAQAYLRELYQQTQGDTGVQVSMFDIGAALALEREAAGKIAEELIGNGLAEVKTLSGGIGITLQGIETIDAHGGGVDAQANPGLGNGAVLEADGKSAVAAVISEIQTWIVKNKVSYDQTATVVIDLKTMEVQLLSPSPKTAVIREVLRSLHSSLDAAGGTAICAKIIKLITV